MSFRGSSRIFAIVAVAAAGLAGLKALHVTDGALDVMTLTRPAYAAGGEEDVAPADPRGPLDILETEETREARAEVDAADAEAMCAAPQGLAERSGLSLSELQVLRSLSQRRRDLDAREQSVIEREGLLEAAEARVEERIEELHGLETRITELLGSVDDAEEAQLNALVALYSRMRSDDAARIFGQLEDDVLIQVASRMSDQALAPILADMPGAEAAELTMALARRHETPDTLDALPAPAEEAG